MPIAEAVDLLNHRARQRSSERPNAAPILAEHDPIADLAELERLATLLVTQVSPLVGIEARDRRPWAGESLCEPESLFCQLDGVTHLFDDEPGLLEHVKRMLHREGYQARLAIASNSAAAWALTHYHSSDCLISTDQTAELSRLPVASLRIATETHTTLSRLGIETLGQLWNLPRGGLAQRLGEALVDRMAEIQGEVESPLTAFQQPIQFSAKTELEYATDDLELICNRMQQLLDQVLAAMKTAGQGVLRLVYRLQLIDAAPLTAVIGLYSPTRQREHLMELIQANLESINLRACVCKIALSILQSEPLRASQPMLFDDDGFSMDAASAGDQSLAQLVNTLSGRLGYQAVQGVRVNSNPLPEKAYRTYPLTDYRSRKLVNKLPGHAKKISVRKEQGGATERSSFPTRHDARRRPVQLLRRPVPIECLRREQDQQSSPTIRYQGQDHLVKVFWGPERIETAWWDGPSVRRDYYRVQTDSGNLWWIFTDLKTGQWYLHGRFG